MMLSHVWWRLTSVAYIGPESRTERPRKTKTGTEVSHVTYDSDTTFKVKRSKVKVTGAEHIVAASHTACYSPPRGALSDDAVWRMSVCLTYDVCRVHPVAGRRVRPAGWMARIGWSVPARPAWLKAAAAGFRCRPGRGHIVAAARLQLVIM